MKRQYIWSLMAIVAPVICALLPSAGYAGNDYPGAAGLAAAQSTANPGDVVEDVVLPSDVDRAHSGAMSNVMPAPINPARPASTRAEPNVPHPSLAAGPVPGAPATTTPGMTAGDTQPASPTQLYASAFQPTTSTINAPANAVGAVVPAWMATQR